MANEGESNYKIKDFYQGSYSSLKPNYGSNFTGYRTSASSLGLTTDPRNANFLQEVSSKLSTGVKQIEVVAVSPEIFDSVPKQQLKEINRLAQLTGIDISLHGPVVDPSGFTQQGYSEVNRNSVERQMIQVVERAHEINPDGNINVTFHSSASLPGEIPEKGKKIKETLIIDPQKGAIHRIPLEEKKYWPGEGEVNSKKEIENLNKEYWLGSISHLSLNSQRAGEQIRNYKEMEVAIEAEKKAGREMWKEEKRARSMYNNGVAHLQESYREIKELFETASQKAKKESNEQNILKEFSEKVKERVNEINKDPKSMNNVLLTQEIVEEGIEILKDISPPKRFESLIDFSKNKTTETIANVALSSFNKFKDKSPILTIENPPAGAAFSTGEELKDLVEKSREKFVQKAVESGNLSEKEAKKQAEKLIGVTWDVGHINMLRKIGYEGKDLIKETEKVAPLVKHVHLSDNFGFEHTELPMGMGNVPIKEMMERLDKEGFEGKKIIEAASWWQHFKTPPVSETLEGFGSPFYTSGVSPSWNQSIGLQQGYSGGYGEMIPSINYQTFGAGFSQLPSELGGQRGGGQGSRMSGRGME